MIQNFTRQPDGSLLCRDDQQTTMTADDLSAVFANKTLSWRMDVNKAGGVFASYITSLAQELKDYNKSNLVYVQMNYDNTIESYICTFFVKKGSSTFKPTFYLTLDQVGETQIKMNFAAEGDKAAQTYSERCPSMKAIVDELGSHTYNMSANSLLAPVNMTLTQSDAPANYSVWNL